MTAAEEAELVDRARGGDRDALGQVWDEVSPKLFGYLVNVLRNKTVAEDVFQNTWLKVVEALPKYQQRGVRFSAWLFAIARNECGQHWRKANRETDSVLDNEPAEDASPALHHKLLIDKLLLELSEDDRELLRLRYIADLPVADIARTLGSNAVAIRVRLSRAIARARKLVATETI
jgi:RNA polymerase sigma-70 factor (ECF subfamily)